MGFGIKRETVAAGGGGGSAVGGVTTAVPVEAASVTLAVAPDSLACGNGCGVVGVGCTTAAGASLLLLHLGKPHMTKKKRIKMKIIASIFANFILLK
jgi:hypothetical protein